jgi:MYXO-CTERM domain-containing protein
MNAPSDGEERVIADAVVIGIAGGGASAGGSASASASGSGSAGGSGARKGWHSTCGCRVVGAGAEERAFGMWAGAGLVALAALAVDRRRSRRKGLRSVRAPR